MKRLGFLMSVWIAVLMISFPVLAEGRAIEAVLTQEDVGNGYEYTVPGIGSFYVNGKMDETLNAAVISIQGEVVPELYLAGEKVDFDEGVILDNGTYELRLFSPDKPDGDYGVFRFSVKNDYNVGMEVYSAGQLEEIENPKLTLLSYSEDGFFSYGLPDGKTFQTSIPVGGWSSQPLKLKESEGITVYRVLKNGKSVDFTDGLNFYESGSYQVTMRSNELGLEGGKSYLLRLTFRIVSSDRLNISHLNAPMGFKAVSIVKDGQEKAASRKDSIHLFEDGKYQLNFLSEDGKIIWRMNFTRDTIPPYLTFSTSVTGEEIEQEVSFLPSEEDCRIQIRRNLKEIPNTRNLLTEDGSYEIEISDSVGNSRSYWFVIHKKQEWSFLYWFIIPAVFLAAAGGVIVYWRRNMRVL